MDLLGKTVPNRYLIGQELLAKIAFQEKKKLYYLNKIRRRKNKYRKTPAFNTNWKDKFFEIFIRPMSHHNSVLRAEYFVE